MNEGLQFLIVLASDNVTPIATSKPTRRRYSLALQLGGSSQSLLAKMDYHQSEAAEAWSGKLVQRETLTIMRGT